jgi:hypothetical protein
MSPEPTVSASVEPVDCAKAAPGSMSAAKATPQAKVIRI